MKVIPINRVEFIDSFPKDPTDQQIESVLYVAEGWSSDTDERKDYTVISFSDIKEFFDGWDQYNDYCEIYFKGEDTDRSRSAFKEDHYETVYNYIRDCLWHYGGAFHPCRII